jgi:zinc D-Ala-D-Ala carboxypeptidase
MIKLTEHFFLEEFIESDYALRRGIKNIPSPVVKQNLLTLANGLERIRTILGHSISITSGYRCIELNRAIGGASTSAHLTGYAADFKCYGFGSPTQVVKKIMDSDIDYDQLIDEGNWIHVSFEPKMRNQTLKATFDARGKASYKIFN